MRLQRGRARGAPRAPQPAPSAARRRSLTRSSTQPAAPAGKRGRIPARPIASRPKIWSPALRAISYPKVTKPFCRLPSPCIRFIDQSLFSLKTCCGSWYGARRYSRAASPRTTWVSRAEAHRVRTRRRGLGPLLWLSNGPPFAGSPGALRPPSSLLSAQGASEAVAA